MSRGQGQGTWARWYEGIYTHKKTKRAAAVLIEAGVPKWCATELVSASLHRLDCWAIRDGVTGRTHDLEDEELAAIAWPGWALARNGSGAPFDVGLIRLALRTGGYLRLLGAGRHAREHLHEFEFHNREIIAKRLGIKVSQVVEESEKRWKTGDSSGHRSESGDRRSEAESVSGIDRGAQGGGALPWGRLAAEMLRCGIDGTARMKAEKSGLSVDRLFGILTEMKRRNERKRITKPSAYFTTSIDRAVLEPTE